MNAFSKRWMARTLIASCLCLAPTLSKADDFEQGIAEDIGLMGVAVIGAVVATPGLVFITGNAWSIKDNQRPHYAWRLGSYISGGLNAAVGILDIACAIGSENDAGSWLALGIGHLVISGFNIALPLWGSGLEEQNGPKISLAPIAMIDSMGDPAVGVGLQVIDW